MSDVSHYADAVAYIWIAVFVLAVLAIIDMIVRWQRKQLSGRALALWVVAVLIVPFAGVVAYAVVRVVSLRRGS